MRSSVSIHPKFLLGLSGMFLLFLSGCGVRGPLYFPPAPPQATKPNLPEPIGPQFPVNKKDVQTPTSKP
jgi:predicted small lipoprotein YifL